MKQLICDSGGTKSSWLLLDDGNIERRFDTEGMNPAVNSHDTIRDTINKLPRLLDCTVDEVWFYGAGCAHGTQDVMRKMISDVLPEADVNVNTDMLGAARALCQDSEGIACILGTGANSCYYNGRTITQNTPSLGYILGDEGGGAVLGRILVNRLYKGLFPSEYREMFEDEMKTNLNTIIENVYRKPQANRYLASFTYFLSAHRSEECIHGLLTHCFGQFFRRNIAVYRRRDLRVGFVGSLAHVFAKELREAAFEEGFSIGKILQSPIDEIAHYHIGVCNK